MNPSDYKPDFHDWYVRQGVSPPKSAVHGVERELFESMLGKVEHGGWVQKGNFITCTKCPNHHSHSIPVDYILDNPSTDKKGYPRLTKVGKS